MLQEEILPRRKSKLPEQQQQYLWKRFLALLPDLLDAVTPPQPAELQRAGCCATLHVGRLEIPAGLSLTRPQQGTRAIVQNNSSLSSP